MSEERIRILEKKVDLLYRMHMDDNFDIRNNLDEFIPLFNLSVEMGKTEKMEKMEKIVGLIKILE